MRWEQGRPAVDGMIARGEIERVPAGHSARSFGRSTVFADAATKPSTPPRRIRASARQTSNGTYPKGRQSSMRSPGCSTR
jgi:hypothetical protein